jgi:hypothetical protein
MEDTPITRNPEQQLLMKRWTAGEIDLVEFMALWPRAWDGHRLQDEQDEVVMTAVLFLQVQS